VALLLEYLAPVLLIGYHWLRTRRRPASGVLAGAVVALAGLALVLDVRSVGAVHPLGLLWGLGAALCLSAYFLLTEERGTDRPIHPVLLTVGGTGIGGGLLVAAAAAGLLPLVARTGETRLAGSETPWWLPALALVLVSAVLAYLTGIVAVRRLGSSAASFVGLTEVLFAVAFAAILLGQHPGAAQLAGGVLVLIGITLVQRPPRRRGRSTLAR
jgi:drug/metabolite transporter (DMT)-like permease